MKKIFIFLPVVALLAGVFGVTMIKTDSTRAEAAWTNETVRIYLDKTTTIAGLSWWQTDSTYIHIWDGTTDYYELMTKVNNNLFYFDVVDSIWDNLTDNTRGMEFYVFDQSSAQNQTFFTDGPYLKTNELNYFKLDSANATAKQSFVIQNKEVEEAITAILALTCTSTKLEVDAVVTQYNSLRPLGKSNLNTWQVGTGDVTFYQRLVYIASVAGSTPPSVQYTTNDPKHNVGLIASIGLLSLTAIAGFYFLKTKKQ